MAMPLSDASGRKKDPWDAFHAGCPAFLDECLDPGLQRIVLLDASAAIGWEQIRHLESPLLQMMELAISRAAEVGRVAPRKPGSLAHFLYGALCETAMIRRPRRRPKSGTP
jgi:tetracycline repressor-like protein